MEEIYLFTDGSVNVQSKVGFGALLIIDDLNLALDSLKPIIKTKVFEDTSSSKLEIQTLIWGLSELSTNQKKVTIFTDSQNIVGLPSRRERLEKNNYKSKNNKPIINRELYKEFYKLIDQLDYTLIKVDGHKKSHQKSQIDKLFTLVDRASRKTLRNYCS